ncbi:hypothetical protein ACFYZI_41425 [Streptomyces griseorubiginosus]|uniref:hypothetical protein n=1 Tax=Streptomyces griseorubiginosus TaxID=67304 RepID=UPI0036741DA2
MTDEKDDQFLRQLLTLLEGTRRFDTYTSENKGQWQVQPRSSLAGDDAKSHPHQVSHSVSHALTVAVNHLQCLRSSVLTKRGAKHASPFIRTYAQASLVRGVFENSARAVWLLGPANRLERLTRCLRLQANEVGHGDRLRELAKSQSVRTKKEHLGDLEELLVEAGALRGDARKALNDRPSYKRIVREVGLELPMGADAAELVWSACSSLAHGDSIGTLTLLDRKIVESDGTVGLAEITGDVSLFFHVTYLAVRMVDRGVRLYEQRATAYV